MKVVVTGAGGFIGRNLCATLDRIDGVDVNRVFSKTQRDEYSPWIKEADVIYHLAGVNRPKDPIEFVTGNANFTRDILEVAAEGGIAPTVVLSSTTQAVKDNDYGKSKRAAEELIKEYSSNGKIHGAIYRLPGVFGKWCKPNYNSVVSTFCNNVANELLLEVRDPSFTLPLVYVDDVVQAFLSHLNSRFKGLGTFEVTPVFNTNLGELADIISSFPGLRETLRAPKVGNGLEKRLYSTYLSHLPTDKFSYPMELKKDNRGDLFEWIKSEDFGQVFVSTTKPGITRGNHYHHTKTEKFLVIRGEAEIGFRQIDSDQVMTYQVNGSEPTVVDIPPGYTHNITNTGQTELITLFWANEIFNSERPDTYFLEV
ncbi:NAD-dependent epimerase/dehydratase family protein [Schleiferiaceae bacterium]|nr:NAD-dependent epimerase/dehydratase family protein [Schleiferiaceae bacterium]